LIQPQIRVVVVVATVVADMITALGLPCAVSEVWIVKVVDISVDVMAGTRSVVCGEGEEEGL
jgi:hypothetical protein